MKPPSSLKRLVFGLFFIIIAFIVALPSLLNVPIVDAALLRLVRFTTGYEVEYQSASFGWTSGVQLQAFKAKDPKSQISVEVESFSLPKPLYSFFTAPYEIGSIAISGATFLVGDNGDFYAQNLRSTSDKYDTSVTPSPISPPLVQQQITSAKAPIQKALPIDFTLPSIGIDTNVAISNSRVFVSHKGNESGEVYALVDNINGTISITPSPSLISAQLNGVVVSSKNREVSPEATPFEIDIQIIGKELFKDMKGRIIARLKEIPSLLIEGIASIASPDIMKLVQPVLGQKSSLAIEGSITPQKVDIDSVIVSDNLKSSFHATATKDELQLSRAKILDITLTKELFKSAVPLKDFSLRDPVSCTLAIDDPVIYSFATNSYVRPLKIRFTHSPNLVIDRSQGKPFSLICAATLTGDDQGESVYSSITADYGKSPEKAEISFSCLLQRPQETASEGPSTDSSRDIFRDFSSHLSIRGSVPKIFSEETSFPLAALIGPSFSNDLTSAGTLYNDGTLSYAGKFESALERGTKWISFSGSEKKLQLEAGKSDLFLPYRGIQEALQLNKGNYTFTDGAGIRLLHSIDRSSIPLTSDINDFIRRLAFKNTLTIQCDALECRAYQVGITDSSSFLFSAKKVAHEKQFIAEGTLQSTVSNTPEFLQRTAPKNSPLELSFRTEVDASDVFRISIPTLSSTLGEAFVAHLQDIECAIDVKKEKPSYTISLPTPCSLLVALDTPQSVPHLPKGISCSAEYTFSTANPLEISHGEGISKGLIQSKCNISAYDQTYTASFPLSFDAAQRRVYGSSHISRKDYEILVSKFFAAIPDDLSLKSLAEELDCSFELSLRPIALQDFAPLISSKALFRLQSLLGNTIHQCDLKTIFKGISSNKTQFSSEIKTDYISLSSQCKMQDGLIISGLKPLLIYSGTLAPGALQALVPSAGISIAPSKPVTIVASVQNFSFPLSPLFQSSTWKVADILREAKAQYALQSDNISLIIQGYKRGKEKQIELAPLISQGSFDGANGSVNISANMTPLSKDSKAPRVDASIVASLPLNSASSFQEYMNALHLDSKVTVDAIDPTLVAYCTDSSYSAMQELLGSRSAVSAEVHVTQDLNGDLKASFTSQNCIIDCKGALQEGIFTPTQPIEATITVTKKTGKMLLKDVNPLLATAVRSENPITLKIPHEGVSIPIFPFSRDTIFIPKGMLSIDKVQVKNGGALKVILSLLRAGQASKSGYIDVWSTPIYFSLKNGVFVCDRTDLLVSNKVQLALWGTVDLAKDAVTMSLLVPNATLHRLGFQALSTHGLIIPITGSTSNPKIDTARFTAKMAALGIRSTTIDPTTQILGGLLEVAASIGEKESQVPPPTTIPFPWDK